MIQADMHMHTWFSTDSEACPRDMADEAVRKGLKTICFTDHFDKDDLEWGEEGIFDVDAYFVEMQKLQEEYAGKLNIRIGIELGLRTYLKDYYEELTKKYPFDFVIGSSHIVHGYDPYYKEYFKGREESACYREYFESILENLHAFSEMDVYGHIDYIVRYGPNQNKYYTYERYQDILDEILRTVIARGRGIELNTGGFHYGLGEPNPCHAVIRRYRELGGEIITVGADAHGPEKIAYDFDKAAAILADCGFKYYTVFQNRKPEFVKL